MISMLRAGLIGFLVAGSALPVFAQNANPPLFPNRPPFDCTKGGPTELDFWIGEWKVTRHGGVEVFGINHFTKEIGGCAIHEVFNAKTPNGKDYLGTSLSFYDPADQQWHQFYVDSNGRRSVYAGTMQGNDWVMIAPSLSPTRGPFLQRMIVRRNPNGSVEQLGAVSTDNGKTWREIFDLDYSKLEPSETRTQVE